MTRDPEDTAPPSPKAGSEAVGRCCASKSGKDEAVNGSGVGVLVVVLLTWIIPIAVVIYVLRVLGTIVEGLRSINAGVQRTAAAVEEMARRLPPA